MNKEDIYDTHPTVVGLCKLANKLGYRDPFQQLINSDGSCVGDLLDFFEDNPGAIEEVINWVADQYGNEEYDEDEDDENEDEDTEVPLQSETVLISK